MSNADMHAAFRERIMANPDDDFERLVYADWLDENDDPERAEFIRIQIEIFRSVTKNRGLVWRQIELLRMRGNEWRRADIGTDLPEIRGGGVFFERGFLEKAALSLHTLRKYEPYLKGTTVRKWEFVHGESGYTIRSLREFMRTEFALQLHAIEWRKSHLSDDAIAAMVARKLPKLQHLDLQENTIGNKGAQLLASAPYPSLKTLNLRRNYDITQSGHDLLAQSPLPHLQYINYSIQPFPNEIIVEVSNGIKRTLVE